MTFDKAATTPLFEQLATAIASDINAGVYAAGDMIPSERELSERYGISRVTVRRAIERLVQRGVLTKRQGKGTFVDSIHLERQITQTPEVLTFDQMCRDIGRTPGTKVLGVDRMPARDRERRFLRLEEGSDVLWVHRLRSADGIPVMYENSIFPVEGFEFLINEVWDEPSIFSLVERRLGCSACDHTQSTLRVLKADAALARVLAVPVGEPLFLENVNFVDGQGEPLFIAHNYVVGTAMVFDF